MALKKHNKQQQSGANRAAAKAYGGVKRRQRMAMARRHRKIASSAPKRNQRKARGEENGIMATRVAAINEAS